MGTIVFLLLKYGLVFLMPFFIAFGLASFFYPKLLYLHGKTRLSMGFLGSVLVIGSAILIVGIVGLLCSLCVGRIKYFIDGWGQLGQNVSLFLKDCCKQLEQVSGMKSGDIEYFLAKQMTVMTNQLQINMVPRMVEESYSYMKIMISALAATVVTFVSTLFILKDYETIRLASYRKKEIRDLIGVVRKVLHVLGVFLKSQAVIMGIVTIICVIAYALLQWENPLFLGIITGLLDAIPFIGTSIVFIPVGIFYAIQGEIGKAAIAFVFYLISTITRDYLEPKLVGDRLGYIPIVILFTIYIGIQLYGISGILLGPITFMLVKEMNELYEKSET